MTTIVYDGKTFVADSLATGSHAGACIFKKLIENDTHIFGLAGTYVLALAAYNRIRYSGSLKDGEFEINNAPKGAWTITLYVKETNQLFEYRGDKEITTIYPMECTIPYASGSGEDYALGALFNGANAEEACKVACKLDIYSLEPLQIIKVK